MSWKVWCPERGETEDDAKQVGSRVCDTFRQAAAYFAEYQAGFSGDPFEEITLHVRHAGDPDTRVVVVMVEVETVFAAGSVLLLKELEAFAALQGKGEPE